MMDEKQLEEKIRSAVDQIALESLREAAGRAFPARSDWKSTFFDKVFGPAALASLVLAAAGAVSSLSINYLRDESALRKQRHDGYFNIFTQYREAHRRRWITGSLVWGGLTWGYPFDLVTQRKKDYDAAYIETNELFPTARDYLDNLLIQQDDDIDKFPRILGDYYSETLLPITTVHDYCLTAAYAPRYDWELVLWPLQSEKSPDQLKLKRNRDEGIRKLLENCAYGPPESKVLYDYRKVSDMYSDCADAIALQVEKAIRLKVKWEEGVFSEWREKSNEAITKKCDLSKAVAVQNLPVSPIKPAT